MEEGSSTWGDPWGLFRVKRRISGSLVWTRTGSVVNPSIWSIRAWSSALLGTGVVSSVAAAGEDPDEAVPISVYDESDGELLEGGLT